MLFFHETKVDTSLKTIVTKTNIFSNYFKVHQNYTNTILYILYMKMMIRFTTPRWLRVLLTL